METMTQEVALTNERSLPFIMAGNATFTLRSKKTGTRFTFKVQKADDRAQWFVKLLSGPDNDSDYRYLGMIVPEGQGFKLIITAKGKQNRFSYETPSVVALTWTLTHLVARTPYFGVEIFHAGRCGRCGRTLTVPESIEIGLGPECASKGF